MGGNLRLGRRAFRRPRKQEPPKSNAELREIRGFRWAPAKVARLIPIRGAFVFSFFCLSARDPVLWSYDSWHSSNPGPGPLHPRVNRTPGDVGGGRGRGVASPVAASSGLLGRLEDRVQPGETKKNVCVGD